MDNLRTKKSKFCGNKPPTQSGIQYPINERKFTVLSAGSKCGISYQMHQPSKPQQRSHGKFMTNTINMEKLALW